MSSFAKTVIGYVLVPEENWAAAHAALTADETYQQLAANGASTPPATGSLEAALHLLGFDAEDDEEGMLVIDGYDNKYASPIETAFASIAPFVDTSSALMWVDEDDMVWLWSFQDGTLAHQIPVWHTVS